MKGGTYQSLNNGNSLPRVRTLEVDLVGCSGLVSACEKATQWRYALKILQQMEPPGGSVAIGAEHLP